MTNEEAEAMLDALSRHYGQPVMPIERYCGGTAPPWLAVPDRPGTLPYKKARVANDIYRHGGKPTEFDFAMNNLRSHEAMSEQVASIFLQIRKSDLLFRLLYRGEKLRSQVCPVHKGQWSGLAGGPDGGCPHGCQLTGWIPEPNIAEPV